MVNLRIWAVLLATGALSCSGPVDDVNVDGPNENTTTTSLYMGETPPTTEAVIFAPGKVSIEGRYEYAMSIHPEGNRLLFSVEFPEEGASVHSSWIQNGSWTIPQAVNLTDGARKNEMEAFYAPDGARIFFAPFSKGMDVRIWTAEVTPEGFQNPQPLGKPVAADPSFYPVSAADGSLYYTNLAKRKIYRATMKSGVITGAEPAGIDLGGHAFPSPNGKFMVLDSASLDSEDQRDIFVAFRNDDGTWGSPRPLGPTVNTEYSETCPSLSPDGRYLFFSRYNEPDELSNIYWVSSDVIELLAPV